MAGEAFRLCDIDFARATGIRWLSVKTLFAILLVFAIACGGTALAKKKKGQGDPNAGFKYMITEANAVSVTVSVGKGGNIHETFKVTADTKVTIDGAPAAARDLAGGMFANIDVADDKTTATSIAASDPRANTHNRH